ncbi:MAG: hypothetical protein AB1664_18240, partial [Thermodesulfobacteriota bacterium]
ITELFGQQAITPAAMRFLLEEMTGKRVSKRILSYVVQGTVGETSVPADGRGSARRFPLEDAALVIMGVELNDLGLNPGRVRTCIATVRDGWNQILNSIKIEIDPSTNEVETDWSLEHEWFLLARYLPKTGVLRMDPFADHLTDHALEGFIVELIRGDVLFETPGLGWPRPIIIFNVSRTITELVRYLSVMRRVYRSSD